MVPVMLQQCAACAVPHHLSMAHAPAPVQQLLCRMPRAMMRICGPVMRMRRPTMRVGSPVMRMRRAMVCVDSPVMRTRGPFVRLRGLVVRMRGAMMSDVHPAMPRRGRRHRWERRGQLGRSLRLDGRNRLRLGRALLHRRRLVRRGLLHGRSCLARSHLFRGQG
jgi:hypothetical protein